jgi:uncharacterized repeat protein (TIGR01451 family)
VASAAVVVLAATGCQPKATEGWLSELVSVDASGAGSSSGLTSEILVSPDGTKVVFVSNTSDLVSLPDTNSDSDVYVRDLASGATTLVSVNAAGTAAADGESFDIALSTDGTKVAFVSTATDLGPTHPPGQPGEPDRPENVYVKDLITGAVDLVSVAATGTVTGDWPSLDPVFDPTDSSRVVFTSRAQNLLPEPDVESQDDLFLRDVDAGTTTLLTPTIQDVNIGDGASRHPSFAADGSALVFESHAYLVEGVPRNDGGDVYRRDMTTGEITVVSWNHAGTGTMGRSEAPVISPDGTMVAYTHSGYDGVPEDPDSERDIYVRDLVTGTTALASAATDYHADQPVFSPDATRLTFIGGLVSLERTGTGLTVIHDERLPYLNPNRAEPSAFTPDGERLLYTSRLPFDPRDTNGGDDLYMLDLTTGAYELVSADATATAAGNYDSGGFVRSGISADGRVIAFVSDATDLTDHRPAGQFPGRNVFVARYDAEFDRTDLVVTGSATPGVVAVGDHVTYRVTVTNEGGAAAEHVTLRFQKPAGILATSVTTSVGRCDPMTNEWELTTTCWFGTLAPDASVQVTVVGTVLYRPPTPDRTAGAVADLGPTVDPDTDDNWTTMPVAIG